MLANGVVGFALSVDGLFHGLVEVAGMLLWSDLVGLRSVQVSLNDGINSGGVNGQDGSLSLLHVDGPCGEVSLNLDGFNNSLLEDDLNWGLDELSKLLGDFSLAFSAEHTVPPSSFDFLVQVNGFKFDRVQIESVRSCDCHEDFVLELDSGILGVDFGDSRHKSSLHSVNVLLANLPGVLL